MDYRLNGGQPPLFNTSERSNECVQSLPGMLETGELSDLTIICGNTRHRVHKFVLCTGSKFFKVACTGMYKESDGEINLPDDDPAAKYGMQGLKKAAKGAFESEIQSGNAGFDNFAEAVGELYTSTVSEDRGLRDVVVKMIEQDILLLDYDVVREVMRATDFAMDVLLYMSQGMRSQARFKDPPQTVSLRVWGS
ncbi:kelch repeat BTB domain-containing protein [Fusarium bulbicola]|nr:kelch repeat BTB domain-containing protein [Fusarium bulbicola]